MEGPAWRDTPDADALLSNYSALNQAIAEETPPARLAELAAHETRWVKRAALMNGSTPREVIAAAVGSNDTEVRQAVAENPALLPDEFDRLSTDRDPFVVTSLGRNENLPVDTAVSLTESSDPEIRAIVAEHPRLPSDVLARLAVDPESEVRAGVTLNPRTSPTLLDDLAGDSSLAVRAIVAENPATPPDRLNDLAENWQPGDAANLVYCGVAMNPSTPAKTLARFVDRWESHVINDLEVLVSVAANRSTPPGVLQQLLVLAKKQDHINNEYVPLLNNIRANPSAEKATQRGAKRLLKRFGYNTT